MEGWICLERWICFTNIQYFISFHFFLSRYYLCEKTDGERYLLLVFEEKLYFYNRKSEMFLARNVKLPMKRLGHEPPGSPVRYYQSMLLDGELVLDKDRVTEEEKWVFYVFDAMSLEYRNFSNLSLIERLEFAHSFVILPKAAEALAKPAGAPADPFSFALKNFYELWELRKVFKTIIPRLPHESDGLILTPVYKPYTSGTMESLLKWKPENTIDLIIRVMHKDWDYKLTMPLFYLEASRHGCPIPYYSFYDATPEEIKEWEGGRKVYFHIYIALMT